MNKQRNKLKIRAKRKIGAEKYLVKIYYTYLQCFSNLLKHLPKVRTHQLMKDNNKQLGDSDLLKKDKPFRGSGTYSKLVQLRLSNYRKK